MYKIPIVYSTEPKKLNKKAQVKIMQSHLKGYQNNHGKQKDRETYVAEDRVDKKYRIRYGERQERSSEVQKCEWKYMVARGKELGNLEKVPETWDVIGSKDSMRITLGEVPNMGRWKLKRPY